ncbi:MAG: hypothetical protein H0V16_11805 [Burkholderiaceae bacterium]|nr:hypothetical protein [Burkholderiaceae bacterium]
MKNLSSSRFALACFGLLSVAVSTAAQGQFKCDQLQLRRVDATACALGAKDVASLRRFVTRTQAIYSLQMEDYVRFEGDEPKAPPARPAQVTPRNSVAGIAPPSR